MPRYSYRCCDCEHTIEVVQTVAEMKRLCDRLRCQRCEGRLQFVFPVVNVCTSTTFMANRDDGFGLDDVARKRAYKKARAQGINPTGKVWMPGLNAWIEGRDDVKHICEARGLGCQGAGLNVKARQPENPPEEKPYRVADDIVANEVERIVEDQKGDVGPKERKQLAETIREDFSGTQD